MCCWQLRNHCRGFLYVVLAGSVAAIGFVSGCSSNTPKMSTDPSKARLFGKITYQGKPFAGYILVQSEEDKRRTAKGVLKGDGSYVVPGAPVGKAKLALFLSPHRRGGDTDEQNSGPRPVSLPAKYSDPSQSGLTVEIQSGRNEYSVDLP